MDVREVLSELSERGITNSEQMVRRWIRQGLIKASIESRQEGYKVSESSLASFIKERVGGSPVNNEDFTDEFKRNRELVKQLNDLSKQFEELEARSNKIINELESQLNESNR